MKILSTVLFLSPDSASVSKKSETGLHRPFSLQTSILFWHTNEIAPSADADINDRGACVCRSTS